MLKSWSTILALMKMLSRDCRLRLTEICCRMRLDRPVTLEERIWVQKLCDVNEDAEGIKERCLYRPFK